MLVEKYLRGTESFAALFLGLIALLVVVPFAQGHALAEEAFVSGFSVVLLIMLYSLYGNHRRVRRTTLLGGVTLFSNLFAYLTVSPVVDDLSLLLNIVLLAYATALIVGRVFSERRVTTNIILGAVCVYLLIGIVWGMGFTLLNTVMPDSFSMPPGRIASLLDGLMRNFIYYSFATLTTLGYGDITPVSVPARYFSVLEAIAGQVYLSVLVARLVGMHISQR
jgi:formate hydrogenlyase subunit 3/multisubunit Na+/H+ antiporter MnhD subunit